MIWAVIGGNGDVVKALLESDTLSEEIINMVHKKVIISTLATIAIQFLLSCVLKSFDAIIKVRLFSIELGNKYEQRICGKSFIGVKEG